MRIALIRHGQTDWNRDLRLQGRSDIPLNDTGRSQALDAAAALTDHQWDLVVSSPLSRARETAELIAGVLGVPLGPSYDLLVERDYGDAEGVRVDVAAARWPQLDYPGVEPESAVAERGFAALERIAIDFSGSDVVVVCHGTLIRLTLAAISERPVDRILNGSVSALELTADGWSVLTINGMEVPQAARQ